jgi:hypothetical protein
MKLLAVFFLICAAAFPARAIDREAFTFTKYDLQVRIEPEQQRIGVRGKISLRNDSASPQKVAVLQISSTLDWRSIKIDGKSIEFTSNKYASDIDHTGAVTEAQVPLPLEIATGKSLDIDIGYEGVIPLDATRLTRIGVPEDKAKHADWDQISKTFSAVRGIGYVAWYPVAVEGASLSDGNSVPEAVSRWKAKELGASMTVQFESTSDQALLFTGEKEPSNDAPEINGGTFNIRALDADVPTFASGNFQKLSPSKQLNIYYLPEQGEAAKSYADIASQLDLGIPVISGGSEDVQIVGLPDSDAAPFTTSGILFSPIKLPVTNDVELSMVYAKAQNMVNSSRVWIREGLAHYAQAELIERQQGRQAALDYLNSHAAALAQSEKELNPASRDWQVQHSLVNGADDIAQQTQAMYVWWMLRDILGGLPVTALLDYHVDQDKDAAYMQRLIQSHNHRDLEWFFDDWVYRGRGLPDFRVSSVYPRKIVDGGYMVTVEIENLGDAGAEVPVTMHAPGKDVAERLEVHAKSKASVRIASPSIPTDVVVNDGSVPESDMSNNTFKVPNPDQ